MYTCSFDCIILQILQAKVACHRKSGPGEFGPGKLNLLVSHIGEFVCGTIFPGEYGPCSVIWSG